MEQPFLREPVQQRMGAEQESSRRLSVESEKWRRHDPRCARQIEKTCADHADDGSLAANGSGLRKDIAALLRTSGGVRRRICPRLVQTHSPRYGPDRALSRPASAQRDPAVAGPDPCGQYPLIGEQDVAALKAKILASGLSVSQ